MMPTPRFCHRPILVVILCLFIIVQPSFAQQAPAGPGLRIIVVQGDGASNVIQQIPAEPFSVVVVDRANRPVSGAIVTFTAPAGGASGDFDGNQSLMTFSDEDGRAIAPQYHPNTITGSYQIEVVAERGVERARASIAQRNIGPRKSIAKVFVGLAIAGAAAAALVTASGGGNNSTSNTTPPTTSSTPTISFGSSTVGAPTN